MYVILFTEISRGSAESDKLHMEFEQLLKALDTLFDRYDGLKLSLASLSAEVFNIKEGARDQAAKISISGTETRLNLSFYLKTLKRMSTAIEQADFKRGNTEASTARDTLTTLNDQVQADGLLKALEAVVAELQKQAERKSESSSAMYSIIEEVLQAASTIVKDITWGLLGYIKEELHDALNYGEVFINADMLKQEVERVKEAIAQVKSAGSENISALGNIISLMEQLCKDGKCDEALLESLKSNAEALGKSCDEKLPSVSEQTLE